ncbi:MAG: tetratricopeptide repeat protein [Treponema sp.]|jgi:tetratricopeptide (TPR) repeat protein|nr:tetratricopeptide repeat protein [Treponema sp.]
MKTYRLTIHILTFFCFLFVFSCAKFSGEKTPDTETVRLYAHASSAYAAGRFTETAEILNGQKKFVPALVLRAKAEYFSENLDKAEASCKKALKLRPSSFEAKLFLARVLREKEDLPGAVKLTESLLADNPQDIRALRLASNLANENGKTEEAAAFLDRAAEFSAESALVLLDRARLKWAAGKGPEALEDLSRAKAMLPWDTPLLRSITNLENIITGLM